MMKRCSIAWLGSVLGHGTLLLMVAYFLDKPSLVGVESVIPLVSYQNEAVTDGDDNSDERGEETRAELLEIVEPAKSKERATEVQDAQVAKLSKQTTVETGGRLAKAVSSAPVSRPATDVSASGAASSNQTTAMNLTHVMISTTGLSPRLTPSAPPEWDAEPTLEELTPKQAKMLDKKLEEFSQNFHELEDSNATMAWKYKGQTYTATVDPRPAMTDTDIDSVTINVTTTEDGKTLSTKMKMRRLAFSNYAQFVNRWDPYVQVHDDELDGRFHANTEISIGASRKSAPRFYGKVTTASRTVNVIPNGKRVRRQSVFLGGLETGVRRINLPKRFLPFSSPVEVSDDQIHHIDDDARIVFDDDGSFRWQYLGEEATEYTGALSDSTTYIMAGPKTKLFLRGRVNGNVLVYSPERIVIEGDLVYAEASGESDDFLGLVSDKNIEIAPPDVTGPGDLSVHGSMYAKRRFVVKRYRRNEDAILHIFGSLTAGSLSATEPRYATRIKYDPRLERQRPPGFPMTDRYEVTDWNRSWQVN